MNLYAIAPEDSGRRVDYVLGVELFPVLVSERQDISLPKGGGPFASHDLYPINPPFTKVDRVGILIGLKLKVFRRFK